MGDHPVWPPPCLSYQSRSDLSANLFLEDVGSHHSALLRRCPDAIPYIVRHRGL